MNFDDWVETTTEVRQSERRLDKPFRFVCGAGNVALCFGTGSQPPEHLSSAPFGGTAIATLNMQASWQTEARAQRVAAIFAAHAAEICAEINALNELPANARVVEDANG